MAAVWLSVNGNACINKVTRAMLVFRSGVTNHEYTILVINQPPRPTQPGHPRLGAMSIRVGRTHTLHGNKMAGSTLQQAL